VTDKTQKLHRKMHPSQVMVLGFALVILLGASLLTLPMASASGERLGFVDALFTATSAVCVTGLVVVDTGTFFSLFGQVVILTLIQVGGLGFMTMTTLFALLVGKRISLKSRLLIQESLGKSEISGVVRITKYVVYLTLFIEGLGAIALSYKFIPLYGFAKGVWFSVFHAVSAFCNAGFDILGGFRSLTPFVEDPLVNLTIMGLIIFGGLGFGVMFDIIKTRSIKKLTLNSKLVLSVTGLLLLTGFLAIFVLEYTNPNTLGPLSMKGKVLASAFASVTPRTAGYNSILIDQMTMPALLLTIMLMFIGGSPGSTAGGIKTSTFGLVLLSIITVIKGEEDTVILRKKVARDATMRAFTILGIATVIVIVMTMILCITESQSDFLVILFEVVSAFGTVGLTMGLTTKLTLIGKLALTFTMFMGRIGVLTFVIAISNRQQGFKAVLHYPEGKINV